MNYWTIPVVIFCCYLPPFLFLILCRLLTLFDPARRMRAACRSLKVATVISSISSHTHDLFGDDVLCLSFFFLLSSARFWSVCCPPPPPPLSGVSCLIPLLFVCFHPRNAVSTAPHIVITVAFLLLLLLLFCYCAATICTRQYTFSNDFLFGLRPLVVTGWSWR